MTGEDEDAPNPGRLRLLVVALTLLALAVGIVWWPGCREYPAVSTKESLELQKYLYAACNTRDKRQVERAELRVRKLSAENKLAASEREAYEKIIALAKAGEWKAAEEAAFRFAKDQVGQGGK